MREESRWYNSSVGQKCLVALTGLFLCGFLAIHLTGNLLLFQKDGGKAFDEYSEYMATNVGIRLMEVVLAAGFLGHILYAARVWRKNRSARPARYAMNRPSENSSFASRTMHLTGAVVLVFLVVHINSFFVPTRFAGAAKPSMYGMVEGAFSSPIYDGFYLFSLALLGYHLRHGFQSALQSFGLRPLARRLISAFAVLFWLIIPIGFAAIPVYFLWRHLARM